MNQATKGADMRYTLFSSPLGDLLLAGDACGLRRLAFVDSEADLPELDCWQRDDAWLAEARNEVLGYLDGRRRSFGVNVMPEGNVAQREVWAALRRIPYGQTRTYGELANRLDEGRPVIAVSRACAANPLPILIPCHRLVAASGLGSYRGGSAIKRHLLDLERATRTG